MPLLVSETKPGRRPGDFGISGNKLCIRKQDQSILCLEPFVPPVPDNWADVVARGNNSGGSITVTGSLSMITAQTNSDPTNVLTVNTVTGAGAPTGTSATPGSLVFNDDDGKMYYQDGTGWITFDTSPSENWNEVLSNAPPSTGPIDPIISTNREITYETGIRIGGNNTNVIGAGATSIAIGATANAPGAVAVALGFDTEAIGGASVSIGTGSEATQDNATALGTAARAIHASSSAVGVGATTTVENQIRLGTASQYVSVPAYLESGLTSGVGLFGPAVVAPADGTIVFASWAGKDWENFRPGTAQYVSVLPSISITLGPNAYYMVTAYINGSMSAGTGDILAGIVQDASTVIAADVVYKNGTQAVAISLSAVVRTTGAASIIRVRVQSVGAGDVTINNGRFSVLRVA